MSTIATTNQWTVPQQDADGRTLKDYIAAAKRRKWFFFIPAFFILIASAAVAWMLPAIYRSTGTILIEQQEIPVEWVPATVTSFADQRIQIISQRVLTTDNLTKVMDKLNLFTEERRSEGTEAVLQRMRDDFSIDMISAKVRDPRSGRSGVATIAFSISFDHKSPVIAQRVTNELVSLYLEENLKTRTQAIADTTRFLDEEADKLGEELSTIDARIAAFKQKNMGRLPEQQDLNLQLMQRAEQALLETQRQIRSMEERKTYLESALAQMQRQPTDSAPPGAVDAPTDPQSYLEALRARYASLSGIYAENHPDLVRLRRQINALEEESVGKSSEGVAAKLATLRAELTKLQERYTSDHPDIVRLQREINLLERQSTTDQGTPRLPGAPDSLRVKTQADLNSVESELRNLRVQAGELTSNLRTIEQRIADTPRAEQQYLTLIRDRENVLAKYRDIRAKQSSARVAEALEQERKGERFSLIEPPQLPQEPIKPNRLAILALGFAASLFGGAGTLIVREGLDQTVHSSYGVMKATGAPVLSVIPLIETATDRRRAKRRKYLLIAVFLVGALATLALVHYFYKPLDVVWYEQVQRRLQNI